MISVGNRDGSKGLDQRFSSKREMDGTELEEGEACSYQEDDTSIDPDVTLSYLDEKLQNVLGHFKKDFEGVVSAESLGAKFGTYGSFLPAYRRSPGQCHPRSPPRVQNHSTPQSLNTLRPEGGHHNSFVQDNVPHSLKHGSASAGSASSFANNPPCQSDQFRQTARAQLVQAVEDCAPRSEVRDQKTLKVRIKVGSDKLSVKKNAAIYSGLGLDGSPSSSFDNSPVESEGLSLGLPSDDHESPSQILQMMTSSPLSGGCLLSPLPDHLIQLRERPKLLQDVLTQSSFKASHQNSVTGHPCYLTEDRKTFSLENSMKLLDNIGSSLQIKKDGDTSHIGFDFTAKETDIDAASCEELVSSALKLPLLSNAYNSIEEPVQVSSNEKIYSNAADGRSLEPMSIPENLRDKTDKEAKSAGNITVKAAADALKEMKTDSGKTGGSKGGTANSSTSADTVGSKSQKPSKGGRSDPVKQKAKKSTTSEGGVGLPCRKEQLPSGDKKKLKKIQVHGLVARKGAMDSANVNELEHSSKQKILGKCSDKYKDFFGDINEEETDMINSPDVPSGDRMKTSEIVDKTGLAYKNTSRERTSSVGTRKEVIFRTGLRGSSHNASSENFQPISDPAPGGADTDDNWVCCDKCQKWRLVPPGSKVGSLPEWLCTMMTWLPDMNYCSISEEETNRAFRARYQLLAENSNGFHVPFDNLVTGMRSADMLGRSMSSDGKMTDNLRKTLKSSFVGSPNQIPSSMKKKQQLAKDQSLTEVREPPLINGPGFQQLVKCSETKVETNQYKRSPKHRVDFGSDGGHARMSKIKSKRELDQGFTRSSKKTKARSSQSGNNDWPPAHDQDDEMLGVNSGYVVATNTIGKVKMANSESFTSPNSKHDMDGHSLDSFGKSNFQVEAFPNVTSLHVNKSVPANINSKKRKTGSFQDSPRSTPSLSNLVPDNEQTGRKKNRISNFEEKESSASKRNGKADKRGKKMPRHSLDDTESHRKDSSSAQPIVASTSSSSKFSGSIKAQSKLQEQKGSPVESVSSSPTRISNAEKMALESKFAMEKDNVQDADKLTSSPRKCSHVVYEGGSDRDGPIRKDKTGTRHGLVGPSMVNQQDRKNGGLHNKAGLTEISPSKLRYGLPTNDCAYSLDPENRYASETRTSDRCIIESTGGGHYNTNVSQAEKSWKYSSALCKDNNHKSTSEKGLVKTYESYDDLQDHTPVNAEKERERRIKVQEKAGSNAENAAICNNQEPPIPRSKAHQDYDEKPSSNKVDMENPEHLSISTREKSQHIPSSHVDKNETSNSLQLHQGNGVSTSSSDAHASDLPMEPHPKKRPDIQNATHSIPSKHPLSNGHRVKNPDAPSPHRRDASSQAAGNALKEAKNLKHLADRLKNAGSAESTGMYFEAALKFLHGASLLESGKTENPKHGDMVQSMQIYSSTAKLCEFCAHEYEKSKDMATAALAYKCMEVAYLRVIYSSRCSASRDRHELQNVLQMVPPGESPSSSASDVDNVNNSATGDKAAQAKSAGSPQLAANLVIAASNRPHFSRLLSFAQDVNFAMEASRKSRVAFAAANFSMDRGDSIDVIASIKTALDFNFHDVEALLRLVRLAKEATTR